MKRLRVAAVGLGWVCLHRHIPAMRRMPDVEVIGVMDRRPGLAQAVATRFGVRYAHEGDTLADVPWIDGVDAVAIATGPRSHGGLIRSALMLGLHVITEKPFVLDLDEGEALVALAREKERILAVVHNFQFARSTRRMLGDLAAGSYGELRYVHARQLGNPQRRLPVWYDELPFGLFYDESPHLFYLLRALAPAPLRFVHAQVHQSTIGKTTPAWISAHYVAGARQIPVKLDLAFEAPLSEWHVSVAGEHCLGDVDVFRDIYTRLPNDGAHTTWPVLRTSLAATWAHWTQHLVSGPRHLAGSLLYGNDEVFARFAQAVRTSNAPQAISADDALAVLRMQHDILRHGEIL